MSKKNSDTNDQAWKPATVWTVTNNMQLAERVRAYDRAMIDGQFNGSRPYTNAEVDLYQIHINVNFQEGKSILIPAINQLNNALIFKERFFSVASKNGPPEKKQEYSDTFTKNIHEHLKNGESGRKQMFLLKSRNASLALHGIGPIMWANDFSWRGRYVALEDLLIPTDTLCDFSNLMFFAVNQYLTVGEFFDMTNGDNVSKGWDKNMVNQILEEMIKPRSAQSSTYFNNWDQPEKMVEWMKQNRFMWDYDAVSTIKIRMFYFKHYKTKKWHRCAILRETLGKLNVEKQDEFLYDGNDIVFADTLSEILHVQFGDNSIVAPLKYHSVRGLGVDLYGPVECNNRTRCEFQQHVSFQMKTLLRVNNPVDRDRPKVLDLSQYSVVEDGITFIPAAERYQIDPRLTEQALSQNRQIMGESGASYVKDVEPSQGEPRSATESSILANQATEAVSNMLQSVYAQEQFYWEEELRRFCRKNSADDEVKAFQEQCLNDGIPPELMKASNWSVKIERVLGGGDQFIATQEANSLLSQSQRFDPKAQRVILKTWTTTTTRDPKMAELLVPDDDNEPSKGVLAAEDVFGTLMQGIPASIREGIERTDYVESLLAMMTAKIQQIQQIDNMGTPQEIIGLQTTAKHVNDNIQILAKDQTKTQQVKIYSDELGKLMNDVKAFAQRQQQAKEAAAQPQPDPALMAKAQATTMLAQQKAQIGQATAAQKMQLNEKKLEQQMQLKQQQFEQQMSQEIERHRLEMMSMMEKNQADLISQGLQTGAQISSDKKKTEATIENQKKIANSKPEPVSK